MKTETTILSLAAGALLMMLADGAAAQSTAICGEWTAVDPPAGTTSAVIEVDAVSADDAWAFAYYLGLVRWDGTTWFQHDVPDLSGEWPNAWIRQFTTFGLSDLFLVGNGDTGPFSNDIFLVPWDGTQWGDVASVTLAPDIAGGARNGAPQAVAAAGPDDVWIVGIADGGGDGVLGRPVLTVHWDGAELTEYLTPGIGNRQNNLYDAVAIAGDDVWAVGDYNGTNTPDWPFHGCTYHWNGQEWSAIPNPTQDIDSSHLYAVDAVASDDVWAAGDSPDGPLFMHWDGNEWMVVPSPSASGTVYGLAAIASDDVWAVDSAWYYPGASKYYHWDGVEWSVVAGPEIVGAEGVSRHGGLAAAGPCDVWAVGSVQFDGQIGPLIERLQAESILSAPEAPAGGVLGITHAAPNPFNPRLELQFEMREPAAATLTIHDLRGRLVRTLARGDFGAGTHTASWDGVDDHGRAMPSGTYLVSLRGPAGHDTRRVALVR